MRKLFLTGAAATVAASAFLALGATPASAAFCATNVDGQGIRGCYPTFASCARTTRGAGGQCIASNQYGSGYGYGGYEDSYAYAPEVTYGHGYGYGGGYGFGGGHDNRPGFGIYIGGH